MIFELAVSQTQSKPGANAAREYAKQIIQDGMHD